MAKPPSAAAVARGMRQANEAQANSRAPGRGNGAPQGAPMTLALQVKLGSIAVHADELLGPDGHAFDRVALADLLQDAELRAWVQSMGPLLPLKRKLSPKA